MHTHLKYTTCMQQLSNNYCMHQFYSHSAYYCVPVSHFQGILTTNAQDNVFFYSPGHSENVICSWNGTDVQKLEWFLEGLDSLPILSETNSTSITLIPDRSTNGLDGTKFTCRATTYTGDQFEETVSVRTKG